MRSFSDSPPHVPRWHGCVARRQTLMPTTWDSSRRRTSTRESRASLVPVVEADRLRMLSVLSIFLAMWLVGCGGTAAAPAGTVSAPPPFVERVHSDFWSAVAALDFEGAGPLAESTSQREFLAALRDVAEERLVEAQMKLLALARSADADIVARSTELLFLVLRERPSSASESLAPRSWRALIRAWRDMSSRESWAFPPHPVTHPLQLNWAGVPLVPVTVNGRRTAFALDTGAWRTVLSSRFAAAASVSTSPVEMTIEGAHGVAMRAVLAKPTSIWAASASRATPWRCSTRRCLNFRWAAPPPLKLRAGPPLTSSTAS